MNKPAFDPNQPFEASKPAFDPNAPFTAGDQNPPETALNKTAKAITGVMQTINMGSGYKGPVNTLEPQGQNLFNRLGENTAEYLGGKNLPGNPYTAAAVGTGISMLNPQNWMTPLKEGPAQIPGQGIATDAAQNLGRRSLGINKGMLNRMKGGITEANQTAQTMLDQGVIKPFSGAESTLGRAEDLAATSGKAVGDALKSTGQNALDTSQVSQSVIDQLAPKYQGGAYAAQEKIANEIVDTIQAHGNGPIDFQKAQDLKNTLKTMAGSNWNTDKIKAAMYQRAYGIVSDALENGVQDASSKLPVIAASKTGKPSALFDYNDPITGKSSYQIQGDPNLHGYQTTPNVPFETLQAKGIPVVGQTEKAASLGHTPLDQLPPSKAPQSYIQNKKLYGASQQAIRGLEDKANREASNSILSLRGAAIGAGALATGNVPHALEALGTWEAARRVGAGTGAYFANKLAQPVSEGLRRAALAAFIDKVTTK